ncbi:MAG: protein jag [Anaerolineales bacterium]|nr:protein jag [Anaerolineales bacterium]MCA9928506.1 protein jag [Anaerolineales bacterium]
MTKNAQEIEARGQNVEQAIKSGLARLGLQRDDVVVEVIDEGSRGLLGIGSRDAVVRIRAAIAAPVESISQPDVQPVVPEKIAEKMPTPVKAANVVEPAAKMETAVSPPPSTQTDEEQLAAERDQALETVKTLLDKMHVDATVSVSLSEPDDVTGRRINIIEINGDDLGVLIGPRGETLGSIQYISRLMVGHKIHDRANFVIDVESYRRRREQALTRLAERMAQKVIKRGSAVALEPMPPNERRIIHMALRENEQVYTQSVGEGDRRKVRILPK